MLLHAWTADPCHGVEGAMDRQCGIFHEILDLVGGRRVGDYQRLSQTRDRPIILVSTACLDRRTVPRSGWRCIRTNSMVQPAADTTPRAIPRATRIVGCTVYMAYDECHKIIHPLVQVSKLVFSTTEKSKERATQGHGWGIRKILSQSTYVTLRISRL